MRLLILSALPRETKTIPGFVGGWFRLARPAFGAHRALVAPHELFLVHTGMGTTKASGVLETSIGTIRPDAVVSLGYCGALLPGPSVGDLLWSTDVCLVGEDGGTGRLHLRDPEGIFERLSSVVPIRKAAFLTLPRWMKKTDVLPYLPECASLPVCEMETYGLARLALEKGLPFISIRSVSDAAGEEVTFDPSALCDGSGAFRTSKGLAFFALHPTLLGRAMRLARDSNIASQSLGRAVGALLKIL